MFLKQGSALAITLLVVSCIVPYDSDARRGRNVQIDFEGNGFWCDEKEADLSTGVAFGPITNESQEQECVAGESAANDLPMLFRIGDEFFDRLWIDENGFVVLGKSAADLPSPYDPTLQSLEQYPGAIIAPLYADFFVESTPQDGCGSGNTVLDGPCDVAYGVLRQDIADTLDQGMDYDRALRVTWGAFEPSETQAIDSDGLREAPGILPALNHVQLLLISRQDSNELAVDCSADDCGDFDIRFYFGPLEGDGLAWESENTLSGFKIGPYVLDFSKYYRPGATNEGFTGDRSNCISPTDAEELPGAILFTPEQVFSCNYFEIRFRKGVPQLVGYTSDLSVSVSTSVATVNATVPYQLNVLVANGPDTMNRLDDDTDVAFTVELPDGTAVGSVTPAGTPCSLSGTQYTCTLGNLPVSDIATEVVLEVISTSAGTQPLAVSVTGDRFDLDPLDNADSTSIEVSPTADLALEQCNATPASPTIGQTVVVSCTIRNFGPQGATGAELTADVPSGASFLSSSDCSIQSGALSCAIAPLSAGDTRVISASFGADSAGTATVNAELAAGSEFDSDAGNNSASAQFSIQSVVVDPPNNGGGGGAVSLWQLFLLLCSLCSRQLSMPIVNARLPASAGRGRFSQTRDT